MENFKTKIRPKTNKFELNLKETFKYRDLIALFVKRNFVTQYKQTILGPAWALINPLLNTVVFTFIFGSLAGLAPDDSVPSFLFYLAGNMMWIYFAYCLTENSSTFIKNANVFGKVYFPRLTVPIASIFTGLISLMIQMGMFAVAWVVYYFMPSYTMSFSWYMLLVPIFILQLGLLGMGIGIIVSSITTKYRDLAMLVSFGVSLLMYASPVAYAASEISEKYMALYMLNPITPILEGFKYAMLGPLAGTWSWMYYGIGWLMTIAIVLIGIAMFNHVEKTFMDTV
ncbi:MAG: ABC transporter permease [Bacillota bacterium]